MAGGGLHDPLGTDRPPKSPRAGSSFPLIALICVLTGFAGLFATAAFRDGGERGEPRAVAPIGPVRHSDPAPTPRAASPLGSPTLPAGLPGGSTTASDQEVEIQNGVRVIRLRHGGTASGGVVVKVPAAASAPSADASRLETGSSGPLPQGSDGKPWVSIVVGSLGSDPDGTGPAAADWPAAATLGFGVDGTDLPGQVAAARAAGHEVVLMLPPRKAGPADAGSSPTGSSAPLARDRLHWNLSRFTGYAGVVMNSVNQDAASVVADVLDVTRRGLYVVDDTRAAAAVPTPKVQEALPMTKADLVLAGPAEAEALARFLDRLATLARVNGSAIGIAPASPRSLAAIARFAAKLADSGVALVPLSAVVGLRRNAGTRPTAVAAP